MKNIIIVGFILQFAAMSLSSHSQNPEDYKRYHYLSAEEMLQSFDARQSFQYTDPPPGPVRMVAEFNHMQGVLIRSPFGVPMNFVRELSEYITVVTIVASINEQQSVIQTYSNNNVNLENCEFLVAASDSYWTRDYGPWFVFDGNNQPAIVDFPYDRPRPNDNNIPSAMANYLDIDLYAMDLIHTGGNWMCDGMGQAASTDLVLDENPGLSETDIGQIVSDYLGIDTYHITIDPLDDYIKHIDCWGKFLDVDKVLIGQVPESDYRYDMFESVADYFTEQNSSYGKPFEVYRVYTPGVPQPTPYTNSIIVNNKVFVPLTGSPWDDEAMEVYEEAMPGYEVIGISYGGWYNTDAIHCRSKGIADLEALYLEHIPLSGFQTFQEDYELTVEVSAYSGEEIIEDQTYIFYKFNQNSWDSSLLVYQEGNTWSGIIPGVFQGDEISYFFKVADGSGRVSTHPYIGQADAHTFRTFGLGADRLALLPDTLIFDDYTDFVQGKTFHLTNISNDVVSLDTIYEYGPASGWYIEELPVFPFELLPDDTLSLEVYFNLPVQVSEFWMLDSITILSSNGDYYEYLLYDADLISQLYEYEQIDLKVFPNPFGEQLYLKTTSAIAEPIEIKLFDGKGKIVFQQSLVLQGQAGISIPFDLPVGLYLYEIKGKTLLMRGKLIRD